MFQPNQFSPPRNRWDLLCLTWQFNHWQAVMRKQIIWESQFTYMESKVFLQSTYLCLTAPAVTSDLNASKEALLDKVSMNIVSAVGGTALHKAYVYQTGITEAHCVLCTSDSLSYCVNRPSCVRPAAVQYGPQHSTHELHTALRYSTHKPRTILHYSLQLKEYFWVCVAAFCFIFFICLRASS